MDLNIGSYVRVFQDTNALVSFVIKTHTLSAIPPIVCYIRPKGYEVNFDSTSEFEKKKKKIYTHVLQLTYFLLPLVTCNFVTTKVFFTSFTLCDNFISLIPFELNSL